MNSLTRTLLAIGLVTSMATQGVAGMLSTPWGNEPEPRPRAKALVTIEADRVAVIARLAADLYGDRRENVITALEQMENHELIDLMVGGDDVDIRGFGTEEDFADMVYTALEAPCRILDTRHYGPGGSTPIPAGVAREVWSHNINGQGGHTACTVPLVGKSALVVALSAFSPSFPGSFPGPGYGTLIDGANMSSGWSSFTDLPSGHEQFKYNSPPYNDAVSIVWDKQTALTETLAIVTTEGPTPEVVLFSAGAAHYAIDVVGYFDDPRICPEGTTLIDGLCWGPEQDPEAWWDAGHACSADGGSLPTASAANGAMRDGDLPNKLIWAAGYYWSSDDGLSGQAVSLGIHGSIDMGDPKAYRCVFTPLAYP